LASKAGFYLSLLHEFAALGDAEALSEISEMLATAVGNLNDLPPEFLRPVARQRFQWPVIAGQHPLQQKQVAKDLAAFQVGEATGWRRNARWGTGWGGKVSAASGEAICLLEILKANAALGRRVTKHDWQNWPAWAKKCRTLPPLTKATAPQWFKIGWQAILDETNGKPESVPELAALVESTRAGKYARRYVKAQAGRTRAEVLHRKESPKATAAADARARIKERIAQAVESLAAR
jgi:hypothetical protein